jgi:hypothetical protein
MTLYGNAALLFIFYTFVVGVISELSIDFI